MELKSEFINKSGKEIWEIVTKFINDTKSFHSITNIEYEADVRTDSIYYKGGSGNRGILGETIDKNDFISAFDSIKNLGTFNTNLIKDVLDSKMYRKRTPFIGLLLSSGIIQK